MRRCYPVCMTVTSLRCAIAPTGPQDGSTALRFAIPRGHCDVIRALIHRGADISGTNADVVSRAGRPRWPCPPPRPPP